MIYAPWPDWFSRAGDGTRTPLNRMDDMDASHFIGCAGWNVPADLAAGFPEDGTHLERYSAVFNAVEINSSFHRPHRPATYERWAASVPASFRFSVKIPKAVTHAGPPAPSATLDAFLDAALHLGPRLGALLAQFPPSQEFDAVAADHFFMAIRRRFDGPIACEPRNPGWFGAHADDLFQRLRVARVGADPAPIADGKMPGGWNGVRYHRLHGSPQRYYSSYSQSFLTWLADTVAADDVPTWCIFDNTASGAAAENALRFRSLLQTPVQR